MTTTTTHEHVNRLADEQADLNHLYAVARRQGSPFLALVGETKLTFAAALERIAHEEQLLTWEAAIDPATRALTARLLRVLQDAGLDPRLR